MIGLFFTAALAILGIVGFAVLARRRDRSAEGDYFAPILTQSPSRYGTNTPSDDRTPAGRMRALDLEQIRAAGL